MLNPILKLNNIYVIDALSGLQQIPDHSIHLAFIDPPYNVGKDYGVWKDNLPPEEYSRFMLSVLKELRRVTIRGFGVYISWQLFRDFWAMLPDAEPIIIYKRSSGSIFSSLRIMQHHHIILTTAQAIKPTKSVWDDIRVYGEGYLFREETYGHPAPTSLKATMRYINSFSNAGESVLDCFMGIGTTAVACQSTGRDFIGFELNPLYRDIAMSRLAQKNVNSYS